MATEDIVEMQSLYRELLQEKRKLKAEVERLKRNHAFDAATAYDCGSREVMELKAEIERLREDLLEVNTELGIYQEIYGDYDAELNNTGGE